MSAPKNELDLCEAVIRLFEQDTAAERTDVRFPEVDRIGPPVECRFGLAGRRYAIEHTLIEPFTDHIRMATEFQEFVSPIEAALKHDMPHPGVYTLHFPLHPTANRHRRTHPELRAKIVDWVRAAAVALHEESPTREDRHRRPSGYYGERTTHIDGLELRLERHVHWSESSKHDGRFFVSRTVEADLETLRLERIATALDRKLPKLAYCRADGDATILILEFADISVTNHVLIAQALEQALVGRAEIPDYVVIADTTIEGRWNLFLPIIAGRFSIDMEWIEVDPPQTEPA